MRCMSVEIELWPDGPERHRAVHGAGIDVGEAQLRGQAAGYGAFARAGRAVDGDYDAHLCAELSTI